MMFQRGAGAGSGTSTGRIYRLPRQYTGLYGIRTGHRRPGPDLDDGVDFGGHTALEGVRGAGLRPFPLDRPVRFFRHQPI